MALTDQGTTLTEAHRIAQVRNSVAIALLVSQLWGRVVNPDDLDATAAQWIRFLLPYVLRYRAFSASLGYQYAVAFRKLEIGDLEPFNPSPIEPLPDAAVRTSLWVTGPKSYTEKIEKVEELRKIGKISGEELSPSVERALLDQAFTEAGQQAGGAALRHVQNGGREQILSASKEDKRCLGYIRVTDSDPCYFCAMLASRGPVYKTDSFDFSNPLFSGDGPSKAHDNDQCSLEPVYGPRTTWPGQGREFSDLWAKTGNIKDFRREYDRMRRESTPE